MTRIAVLLANGFEDAEAFIVIDVLRRLKLTVETLACHDGREVVSYFNQPVRADALLGERAHDLYDAIVLPGGPQGARNLGQSAQVVEFVKAHMAAGRLVCPLCSAGAHVLAANGLLAGRRYTCSGENYTLYQDGTYVPEPIVEDRNVLSGMGLGFAFHFALTIGAKFVAPDIVQTQAQHIYIEDWTPDTATT
ncbi:DJ-1/PfpI family protein [Uliginosibacterium sp. sgz301328]|uniref:DJ-1/PfpI family protein n=1 Tax=Uliginosibacterium sp. sgz301328 TaxID=3243764 RepID=UPI00359D7912